MGDEGNGGDVAAVLVAASLVEVAVLCEMGSSGGEDLVAEEFAPLGRDLVGRLLCGELAWTTSQKAVEALAVLDGGFGLSIHGSGALVS